MSFHRHDVMSYHCVLENSNAEDINFSICYSQIILFHVLYSKFTVKITYIAVFVHIIIHKYCLLRPPVNQCIASQVIHNKDDKALTFAKQSSVTQSPYASRANIRQPRVQTDVSLCQCRSVIMIFPATLRLSDQQIVIYLAREKVLWCRALSKAFAFLQCLRLPFYILCIRCGKKYKKNIFYFNERKFQKLDFRIHHQSVPELNIISYLRVSFTIKLANVCFSFFFLDVKILL